jgi:hypothetical protein
MSFDFLGFLAVHTLLIIFYSASRFSVLFLFLELGVNFSILLPVISRSSLISLFSRYFEFFPTEFKESDCTADVLGFFEIYSLYY